MKKFLDDGRATLISCFVCLMFLKLFNLVVLSWWQVTAPVWIPAVILVFLSTISWSFWSRKD